MCKFSERVKELRLKVNLSQKELAEKVGVSTRTIQYYELDTRRPKSIDTLNKLAEALHTTPEYLVGNTDVMIAEAYAQGGPSAARDIEVMASEISGLFAGGEIDDASADKVMKMMTEAYWICKEKNKKYGRKKRKAENVK